MDSQNGKDSRKPIVVHFLTFGCSHNFSDSETMAHYLVTSESEKYSFIVTGLSKETSGGEFLQKADLVVYNTCTVKNPSDDKFFSWLQSTAKKKPLIVAGCIPQSQKTEDWLNNYSAIGVDQLEHIVELVEATLEGKRLHFLEKLSGPYERDFLPLQRKNEHIAIIPILSGCLGNCTYCKTKASRGVLRSVKLESVLQQIRLAKASGIKEIWLVSEDNGAYGLDLGLTLPDLLRAILEIKGNFRVRIGMLNPDFAYRYREELAEILQDDRFFTFLHIPIQSANNKVLEDMKRLYTIEEFEEAVNIIREKNPSLQLATDIICGFPTETPDQWDDTMNFIKRFGFDIINISKFYPRPGTLAYNMPLIPTKEVKRRSKELTEWFEAQNRNTKLLGSEQIVLFDDIGKDEQTLIGRTDSYKQVVVHLPENLNAKDFFGVFAHVVIVETTRNYLVGELVFE